MAYRKKGNKYIVDCSYNGKRKTATCKTEEEAKKKEAELLLVLLDMNSAPDTTLAEDDSWTLDYAVKKTVTLAWKPKGEATVQNAMKNAKQVLKFFGGQTKLSQITTDWMDEFNEFCYESLGNSGGTINRKLAVISKVMTVALDRDKLAGKPKIPRQPEMKSALTYLTQADEDIILATFNQWNLNDHADLTQVLIDTGMRIGESMNFTALHVDLKQRAIHLPPEITKNEEEKTVPMTDRVYDIISKRIKYFEGSGVKKIFPYNHSWYRVKWDKVRYLMDRSEDKRFTPHIMRRTCASRLVQRGIQLEVVKEFLGHKTIQVTMRYAKIANQQIFDAAKVLEAPAPVISIAS